jgi:predicted permease
MQSAMAPMITASILASNYGLKPKLSSMMVGVGIPLSFLSLAFWYWILQVI